MDYFKIASQQKLRFQTVKGLLTVEQLWDLTLQELDTLAVSLEGEYKDSGKKSFLVKTSAKDKTAKLRFDIVLDVLNSKSDALEAAKEADEIKKHNEKIIELIAKKQDENLGNKSIKELTAMLK